MRSSTNITITTGVDKLVDLIKEKKRISIDEAAKILSVPKLLVEEWADFLEEKEVIGLEYKFSVPYLVYKELTREEAENRAKEFSARREGFTRKVDAILQYLNKQNEGLVNFKSEFAKLAKELESKVKDVNEQIGLLSKYEEMKRTIDTQILQQQKEFEERRMFIDESIAKMSRSISRLIGHIALEEKKLTQEEKIANLIKKDKAELERKLASLIQKSQLSQKRFQTSESLVNMTISRILHYKQQAEQSKEELEKQKLAFNPLFELSKKYEQKIGELKRKFLNQAYSLELENKTLNKNDARRIQAKFRKLFAKKTEAERIVNKLNTDVEGLKKELKDFVNEAMVLQLSSKSKKVSDYIKEYEQKFNALNKKKERFRGEMYKLVNIMKKL